MTPISRDYKTLDCSIGDENVLINKNFLLNVSQLLPISFFAPFLRTILVSPSFLDEDQAHEGVKVTTGLQDRSSSITWLEVSDIDELASLIIFLIKDR